MHTYYQILATLDGSPEILFGSFEKSDCTSTLDCGKADWKEEGYRRFKITATQTTDAPDPEVYGEHVTGVLKAKIQAIYSEHVEGTGMTCDGEEIESLIHSFDHAHNGEELTIVFEDEYMAEVISGNVACSIYDAIENEIAALGYGIIDTDGSKLTLQRFPEFCPSK